MEDTPEKININSSETAEPIRKKCLLIDDHAEIIKGLASIFKELDNFVAVECHSVEEALNAIKINSPKIIFLDHSLSYGGAEGFEVADKVREIYPEIEIYSTTTNESVFGQYRRKGIKHIHKGDFEGFQTIISGK